MSKHDQFILFTYHKQWIRWRLDILFTLGLLLYCDGSWLFTLCFIFGLNFMVYVQDPFYYFSANKKYPLFSILHGYMCQILKFCNSSFLLPPPQPHFKPRIRALPALNGHFLGNDGCQNGLYPLLLISLRQLTAAIFLRTNENITTKNPTHTHIPK